MIGDGFYRRADDQLCQGDVFDGVASVHLRPPIQALKPVSLRGGRKGFEAYPFLASTQGALPEAQFDFSRGEHVSAFCQSGRAVVISYGCEIDQDKKHLLVALARPLAAIKDEDNRRIIRENRNFGFWHMPADARFQIAEGYVDLRRITCIEPGLLADGRRLASLSESAGRSLQRQLILYLTRREPLIESANDD